MDCCQRFNKGNDARSARDVNTNWKCQVSAASSVTLHLNSGWPSPLAACVLQWAHKPPDQREKIWIWPQNSNYRGRALRKVQHNIWVIGVFQTKLSFPQCSPLVDTHKVNRQRFTTEPFWLDTSRKNKRYLTAESSVWRTMYCWEMSYARPLCEEGISLFIKFGSVRDKENNQELFKMIHLRARSTLISKNSRGTLDPALVQLLPDKPRQSDLRDISKDYFILSWSRRYSYWSLMNTNGKKVIQAFWQM